MTQFQSRYLKHLLSKDLKFEPDVNGRPLNWNKPIHTVIFAVTSANHSNTRRNPLALHYRAMAIQEFSKSLKCDCLVLDIDDVGMRDDFAEYTIKRIFSKSHLKLNLNKDNTLVLCSTPSVIVMYEKLGFKILPAELSDRACGRYRCYLPWEIVTRIAQSEDWENSSVFKTKVHSSTRRLWMTYDFGTLVKILWNDDLIGDDGDLTETRDYNTYVRGMDEIAAIKFTETHPYIIPGRIGDIGCAVGSWIQLVSQLTTCMESDFYGVEVSRQLFEICEQRKNNGEFKNPFVFFQKRNAVNGLVFAPNSMNTIHTGSLTHEIKSYVSETEVHGFMEKVPKATLSDAYETVGLAQLRRFMHFRFQEIMTGGVWINRDVVGPDDGDRLVLMKLSHTDGIDYPGDLDDIESPEKSVSNLERMSTYQRFRRFAKDFRKSQGAMFSFDEIEKDGENYIQLPLRLACEFITKKDYCDNWYSEMNETFCFWSFSDWKREVREVGFKVHPGSGAYRNDWILKNRWVGHVELKDLNFKPMEYPVTHLVLVAIKN